MTSQKSSTVFTVFRGLHDVGYTWSPFVTKLEARLRFGNVAYRVETGSMKEAPRGKVPYVSVTHADGQIEMMSDSTLIAKALIETGTLQDLNAKLSPSEKLNEISFKALFEERLYFYQGYERWILNYYAMRFKILGSLPWPVQVVVGNIIYLKYTCTLSGMGILKFSANEIAGFCREIWETTSEQLMAVRAQRQDQEGPFWLWGGDTPTEADTVLFGFVVSNLVSAASPASAATIKSHPVLVDYARRIHDHYFPDYELWK
ncbi:uncharacterized protein N7477_007450 [Penicillium maclennaniae]|uniref:uncharacterized protein n=1 Tax=Penicillium maclennaniae TaxID=1343394 RepID=UPI002542521F|nr:uncharacterized protein N7477_007450 [Penicillium maclennaniae]KAJ5665002.1 hypothetical protein N7477_007450 [Penicillium maclennaniae]